MNGRVLSLPCSCLHCTAEQEQSFYKAQTLAVFQNENKSDLEYVALIEKDVTSKRKAVLLKIFLKRRLLFFVGTLNILSVTAHTLKPMYL